MNKRNIDAQELLGKRRSTSPRLSIQTTDWI